MVPLRKYFNKPSVSGVQLDEAIQPVINALGAHEPPAKIWQEPYEHGGAAYKRLCSLSKTEPKGADLYGYTQDISYSVSKIQIDFFKYMIPICLQAWKHSIFGERGDEYSNLEDNLFASWLRRDALNKLLSQTEIRSIENYLAATILELMSKQNKLYFKGGGSQNPVYRWFGALSSFAVLFPGLSDLWQKWWQMTNDGHAIAALQYISCLMYEEDENPIFSAWTKDEGGGPPSLNCTFDNIDGTGWRPENIDFLSKQLSLPYLEGKLRLANSTLANLPEHRAQGETLLSDWDHQSYLVAHRLTQLPTILANVDIFEWPAG